MAISRAYTKDLTQVMQLANRAFPKKREFGYFKKYLKDFFYVYKLNGKILGFIIVIKKEYLWLIATDIEHQGKGIGKTLLKFAKKRFSYLRGCVRKNNKKAINFYLKNGFIKRNILRNYYGNSRDAVLVEYNKI